MLYKGQKGLPNAVPKLENQSRDHERKNKKVKDKGEKYRKQKHRLHRINNGSCRRRLAGHNRRRSKTHPDVSVVNEGSLNDQRDSKYLLMSLLRILTNLHCKYL